MIKARVDGKDGRHLLALGLSGENVTRLIADEPIFTNLVELGIPDLDLVIIYGKTEEDALAQIKALVETKGR